MWTVKRLHLRAKKGVEIVYQEEWTQVLFRVVGSGWSVLRASFQAE